MQYVSHRPAPPLDAFIDDLWWLSDAPAHGRERIVPGGTMELVVNLVEDELRIYGSSDGEPRRFSGAVVSGVYHRPFVIDTREHASIVGVHFKPGGALPFLGGIPPGAIGAAHVDLHDLWGAGGRRLRGRLAEAATPARRFQVLEGALRARLERPVRRHAVVPAAIAHLDGANDGVGALAARIGISHRRLIEVFTAEVGITPKLFGRIRRFQRALGAAQASDTPDWARLALACGYYDQAHLIRDFATFAELSPAAVARLPSGEVKVSHFALPDAPGSNFSNTA